MPDEHDDGRTYVVVVNAEEQHSIWPAERPPPSGWHRSGFAGSKHACLDHIESVWSDLRPLSVRLAIERLARSL